jgi:hypothetical protein
MQLYPDLGKPTEIVSNYYYIPMSHYNAPIAILLLLLTDSEHNQAGIGFKDTSQYFVYWILGVHSEMNRQIHNSLYAVLCVNST